MDLVQGIPFHDEPRWYSHTYHIQCELTETIHPSLYQPLPKVDAVDAWWSSELSMSPNGRKPMRLSLASFKVLANHFGVLEDADQPAIFDPKYLFIIFARYQVPVAYLSTEGDKQVLNTYAIQLHCTLMYNPEYQQSTEVVMPARTRLEIIEKLFYEQLYFTAVEMGFGITHNPQTCKCGVCQARVLLYFGCLPGVNPACALLYLIEPPNSAKFLQGICNNHDCQCNMYAEVIKPHPLCRGLDLDSGYVFGKLDPLNLGYISKYHSKTFDDLSFAAEDGNWRMKAGSGKDFFHILGELCDTPPGLSLRQTAVFQGNIQWTLSLLKGNQHRLVKLPVDWTDCFSDFF